MVFYMWQKILRPFTHHRLLQSFHQQHALSSNLSYMHRLGAHVPIPYSLREPHTGNTRANIVDVDSSTVHNAWESVYITSVVAHRTNTRPSRNVFSKSRQNLRSRIAWCDNWVRLRASRALLKKCASTGNGWRIWPTAWRDARIRKLYVILQSWDCPPISFQLYLIFSVPLSDRASSPICMKQRVNSYIQSLVRIRYVPRALHSSTHLRGMSH